MGDDEKGLRTVQPPGGPQELTVANESSLYVLTFTSRKPEARRFKHWVTHEVLTTLRTTGSDTAPGAPSPQPIPALPPPLQGQVLAHLEVARTLASFAPGRKAELAAACALDTIHTDTGLTMEPHRRGLPAAAEPPARLNATQLGQKLGLSAREMNLRLEACWLQRRNAREERELTDTGQRDSSPRAAASSPLPYAPRATTATASAGRLPPGGPMQPRSPRLPPPSASPSPP
ncbi:Bro-N domain-containing protein [Myxococcus sp. MxC21-1]|nr:Bro-N domain-containing protein [Myxococcus sp. MxC21-1]